jgi:predicted short-subunit dehydrogenase-like oxidoreductase (DUF2520 family)
MKTPRQVGLIVEGNTTKSAVLRFPGLAEHLGPVKSSAFSVAQRVSNFIRSGIAIATHEEFEECDLILIRVPDSRVGQIALDVCASQLNVEGISFVLCETWLPSDALHVLTGKGATVASLIAMPSHVDHWFAIEGQYTAVKRTRRFLDEVDANTIELRQGAKHFYFAASVFAETLPRVLFGGAQQALRGAGITGKQLYIVLEEMAQSMFRDISQGGRAGWTGPLLDCPQEVVKMYQKQIQESAPELAQLLSDQLRLAEPYILRRMQRRKGHNPDIFGHGAA